MKNYYKQSPYYDSLSKYNNFEGNLQNKNCFYHTMICLKKLEFAPGEFKKNANGKFFILMMIEEILNKANTSKKLKTLTRDNVIRVLLLKYML